jgi:hypothetical protein
MKVKMLTSLSTVNATFSRDQVVELETHLAQSWIKSNFASLVGDNPQVPVAVVVATAPPTLEARVPVATPSVFPPLLKRGIRRK